jgi:quercetin dioxygenase-like cupin family protein
MLLQLRAVPLANAMDENKLIEQLEAEGFVHAFVRSEVPERVYPEHTHAGSTVSVILDGELTVTMNGRTQTFRAGDRCDVPAGTVHSARAGPRGCRYIVGER